MKFLNNTQRVFSFLLLTIALLITGCAATGPRPSEIQSQLSSVPAGKARVYFYRDTSIVGAIIQPNIMINGTVVGEAKRSGFFYVDLTPGTYLVTARTEATAQIDLILRESQVVYIRSNIAIGLVVGRVQFTMVHEEEGRRALMELSYTGSATASTSPTPTSVPTAAASANTSPAVTATQATPNQAVSTRSGQYFAGQLWNYTITDNFTRNKKNVQLRVDRVVPNERIIFSNSTRIEDFNGKVLQSEGNALSGLDAANSVGGWIPQNLSPGMSWNMEFEAKGESYPTRMRVKGTVLGTTQVSTPAGVFEAHQINFEGYRIMQGHRTLVSAPYESKLWFAPSIKRIVKFNVVFYGDTGRSDETIELEHFDQ
jgi:hypothetical protein